MSGSGIFFTFTPRKSAAKAINTVGTSGRGEALMKSATMPESTNSQTISDSLHGVVMELTAKNGQQQSIVPDRRSTGLVRTARYDRYHRSADSRVLLL